MTSIPNYRAYLVWPDGSFDGFESLACVDDDQAIKQARCLVDKGSIELWSGERFVTRIEHEAKAPPPYAIIYPKTSPMPYWGRLVRGIGWLSRSKGGG